MRTFTVDLPYQLVLAEEAFRLNIRGVEIVVSHSLIKQKEIDHRLGGFKGDFGLMHDQLGLLRFSRLSFALDEPVEDRLERCFFADILRARNANLHQRSVEVALAVCNHFLDKYRALTRQPEVRPLGNNDLALLRYEDERTTSDVRLYGGGIRLPMVGFTAVGHDALLASLAREEEPPAYELAILDAIRAGLGGSPNEAVIVAVGALETAFDSYFITVWRRSSPPVQREQAARTLGVQRSKTIPDVLKAAGIWKKLDVFNKLHPLGIAEREELRLAIEARNVAVHGGVKVPPSLAQKHVRTIDQFLNTSFKSVAPARLDTPTRVPLAEAYEQATGLSCPLGLQAIVERYLMPYGLAALLYSAHPKHSEGPIADHFGQTMVIQIPFDDTAMTAEQDALVLARMAIHFSLSYQGTIPIARMNPTFNSGDERLGWSFVAWELTRAVWELGADKEIMAVGMTESVRRDMAQRKDALLQLYGASYVPPPTRSEPDFVAHMHLARVAASLSEEEAAELILTVTVVAPQIAHRANQARPALRLIDLRDHGSVLEGLLQLHDAHPFLLAAVAIYDPATRSWSGSGVNPTWKGG